MLYLLVSAILGYILFKEVRMRWNYDVHKIPAPPKLPILGHLLSLRKGNKTFAITSWIQEWREKLRFPKLVRLCLFWRTIVLVTDINLVRDIVLARSYGNSRDAQAFRHFQRFLMGDDTTRCMFTIAETTPYVKAIRRCYATSFTSEGMKTIFKKQMEVMLLGKLYLEKRQNDETIDIQDFFTRLMLDVAGKGELNMDLGGLNKSSPLCDLLIQCGHHLSSLAATPFLELRAKLFPNSRVAGRLNQDFKNLQSQWTKLALEVCNRGEPEEEDVTFAANLRRLCMPCTIDPLPFNLLRGELASAIVGGFDTTGHQLAWIFSLLATHPHVVERLLDELKSHGLYSNNARELKFEDLNELKYLTAVVKEAMRRVQITVFVSSRVANQDLVLDGYRVPKGLFYTSLVTLR